MWIDFKKEQPNSNSELYQVFCRYNACKEQNVAYIGDDGFFYSEETDKLLPVTHWKELEENPKEYSKNEVEEIAKSIAEHYERLDQNLIDEIIRVYTSHLTLANEEN